MWLNGTVFLGTRALGLDWLNILLTILVPFALYFILSSLRIFLVANPGGVSEVLLSEHSFA